MVAFDWSNIEGITYSFRVREGSKYEKQQKLFNQDHADEITDLDDMLVTKDNINVLIQDPITFIRSKICEVFMEDLDISDGDERDTMKTHISGLLRGARLHCTLNGKQVAIRDGKKLIRLAEQSYSQHEKTIHLELSIAHWMFRKSWNHQSYLKIYLEGHETPSGDESEDDVPARKGRDNDDDSSQSSKSRGKDQIIELLAAQQSMIRDIAQLAARNNDDSSSATNDKLAEALERLADPSRNPDRDHVSTNSTHDEDLPWNTSALPESVLARYEKRRQFLTRTEQGPFLFENKDDEGNVI
jgi:hypothetical protein